MDTKEAEKRISYLTQRRSGAENGIFDREATSHRQMLTTGIRNPINPKTIPKIMQNFPAFASRRRPKNPAKKEPKIAAIQPGSSVSSHFTDNTINATAQTGANQRTHTSQLRFATAVVILQ